ncbi:hypothetical protein [Deminuibacter soli]|nr:hypothetical protein [Deminuibacter soli]
MKKIITILILTCAVMSVNKVNAQANGSSYNTSVGIKGYFGDGSIGGINVRHNLSSANAVEGGIYFKSHYVMLEGLYEWQGDINNAPGLKWYAGPGAQLGFYSFHGHSDVAFALKGAIGLDYKFAGAPIDVAFDLNPTFTLTPDSDFSLYAGLAFRFAF